ncbi:bifunctional diaminohydroxyphosphoribosylaminopyrimidine deaminase/5-amino-6-(5-phosphoribosylamino)uracil reductase RibD [filamentous cyanobacterium LEGE 11480]|uniref:Riboflavin biosynthesis protein RibD n=1 Tax=Romeriopsis navalis LEGE 11480 TaxID=2777977 RepID=A0A928Z658_9CYAN|nr:bifunctional diaminohydroxyphosphoribosylaminopyrimidine deaminase/5-amino-6-(5-phosphoribosylamino)uracil reductase RibD [Romeriopsis navalis]MBE9032702.1 bifunctional diaminohydroxyphosphoribosylaminopyrimidine deaminase/5-amino-6-(5-phosphoribosylamino)uracil reductase RibD [Romeriopsis navalis LEGE 11480]
MTVQESPASAFDRATMQRCLELARTAIGRTAPNPLVGSVIVNQGNVIGEGFHPQAGEPHAEVFALRQAGDRARGATLYVNLEPCSHTGRTPPCAEAIIQAGLARVVVGMVDPNPLVAGQGIARLRQAGIEVHVGIEATDCQTLNEAFIHRMQHHQPFGIFKYAMTLDGKIAASTGHSHWITSPTARQKVHQLRASCDAVIVGGNTVRQDNPHLTTHDQAGSNPLRVVMSRSLDLPTDANLWHTAVAPTIVLTESGANSEVKAALLKQAVEVIELPDLTPQSVMAQLYDRGCLSVLWECGGTLAATAMQQACIHKVWAFIAPKIIGGSGGFTPVGDMGLSQMTEALPITRLNIQSIGPDFLLEGYLPVENPVINDPIP